MKGEALVVILASEGLAQVAVSCQHARRSFVPQCTKIQKKKFFFLSSPVKNQILKSGTRGVVGLGRT